MIGFLLSILAIFVFLVIGLFSLACLCGTFFALFTGVVWLACSIGNGALQLSLLIGRCARALFPKKQPSPFTIKIRYEPPRIRLRNIL